MSTPVIILNISPATWGSVPDAGRRHVDLAGIALGIGDEFGNRLGRNRWIHQHDNGLADKARDRRDVSDEIEIELVIERGVDAAAVSATRRRV